MPTSWLRSSSERVRDRRLCLARALVEQREHAVVVGLEAGLLELRDRLRLHREAEPRQQETVLASSSSGTRRSCGSFVTQGQSLTSGISVAPKRWLLLSWNQPTIGGETNERSDSDTSGGRRPWRRTKWLVLAVIVAAQFMVVLDVAIVNVALPSIQTDLHFSQESLQWVITAYSILFGGVLLLGGRLADLLGRRRLFIIGLVVFTVSSLLDGLAWSEGSLIAFRSLQGLGAALALAGRPVDPHDHVPRGPRAQRRARHLGRGVR